MFIYTDTRIYVYAQTRVAPGDDPTHFNQNAAPPDYLMVLCGGFS